MEYYWTLQWGSYGDLKTLDIPPDKVAIIRQKWANGDLIHLPNASIPAKDIKSFEQSSRLYNQPAPALLEAAAQAFNQPMFTDSGNVKARWVKKPVTIDEWNKVYSRAPGYKRLLEKDGIIMVAFKVAVHDIDISKVEYCSEEEITRVDKV